MNGFQYLILSPLHFKTKVSNSMQVHSPSLLHWPGLSGGRGAGMLFPHFLLLFPALSLRCRSQEKKWGRRFSLGDCYSKAEVSS